MRAIRLVKVARVSRTFASDVGAGLVVILTLLWAAQTGGGLGILSGLPTEPLLLHVWLTILDGGWSRLRRTTWMLLGLTWLGSVAIGLSNFLLPWGRTAYWPASQLGGLPLVGETLAEWLLSVAALGDAGQWLSGLPVLAGAACYLADVAVAAVIRFRRRSARALAGVAFAAVAMVLLLSALMLAVAPPVVTPLSSNSPFLTPPNILPPAWLLPVYTVLRSVPQKSVGLALVFLALTLPLGMPLIRAERFRSGAVGIMWPTLCLALLAVWIALGWLGLFPPEPESLLPTRLLAGCYFAFFLVAAPLVSRLVPKPVSDDAAAR